MAITSDGINVYAARGTGGISRSIDNGINWTSANIGLPANSNVWTVFSNGSKVLAGTIGGLYVSTNMGDLWSKFDSGITGGKVFRSFDGGQFWTDVSPLSYNVDVNAIFVEDSIVLLGAQDRMTGILHSTDWGENWSLYSSGNIDLEEGAA